MRTLAYLILSFVLCATSSADATTVARERITEAQIQQILESIDAAAMQKNAEGIVRYFARDCIIRLDMPGPHGRQLLTVNREEYLASLRESFSTVTDYKYHRSETKIDISPDGQSARVTGKIFETMTVEDRIIESLSQHTAILEVRSDELLITSLHSMFLRLNEELIS
ncbi:MAG: YybH family protein [Candidatus Methylomirabilales bacterium]